MGKCCFIHFKPGNKENTVTTEFDLKIGNKIVKHVSETKFLASLFIKVEVFLTIEALCIQILLIISLNTRMI